MARSIVKRFLVWLGIAGETRIDERSQLVRVGRDEYKYSEDGRSLVLQIEMWTGRSKMIYSSTIKRWLPPHENEQITDLERQRIATKIADFFQRQGISSTVK
jgi:hypothetical protein